MLNINRIKKSRNSTVGQTQNAVVAAFLAKSLWKMMAAIMIGHLGGILLITSIYVTTNVEAERLENALAALNDSIKQLYGLVLTLATPAAMYYFAAKPKKVRGADEE